jgi:ABC-type Fe3+-hydroxamate transport system substrate-binding protein
MAFIQNYITGIGYRRIVSLVPSLTELCYALNLDKETVGITRYCTHPPEWQKTKPLVGGTKNANLSLIEELKPDLVISSREENVKDQVEALSKTADVLLTDIVSLADVCQAIRQIGGLTHRVTEANELATGIEQAFRQMERPCPKKAAYFIWRKPWMVAGGDTFIHHMMEAAGFENVFGNEKRYPTVALSAPAIAEAEYLLLSSEPFFFRRKHVDEMKSHFPEKKVLLVDGTYFSWYGSRLLASPGYFVRLHNTQST